MYTDRSVDPKGSRRVAALTMNSVLMLGMFAGLVSGLLAVGFARVFGEPQVARAIALEAMLHPVADGGASEPVSRTVQGTLGLGVGGIVFAVAVGGIFAIAFALVHGRFGYRSARATAAVLGVVGLVVVYVVPSLKYPANPPSIGDPATLNRRTVLYFTMLAASVLVATLAALVWRRATPSLGAANPAVIAVGVYASLMLLFALSLPGVSEVPAAFPATLLWRFRVAAVGVQVVLWVSTALLFGYLCERRLGVRPRRRWRGTVSAS